jgi:ATP sulfurylase
VIDLSGTELRRRLQQGGANPESFTCVEVAGILRERHDGLGGGVVPTAGIHPAAKRKAQA